VLFADLQQLQLFWQVNWFSARSHTHQKFISARSTTFAPDWAEISAPHQTRDQTFANFFHPPINKEITYRSF